MPRSKEAFPGVDSFSRKAELQKKQREGGISPEEEAELQGMYAFPDDPRGAELRRKQALEIISPEEETELRRKYQQKSDSAEVSRLRVEMERGNTHIEKVGMNEGKLVEVMADDEKEREIWTEGLGGCYGILIFCEDQNQNRRVILTHYNGTEILSNIKKLEELIDKNPAMKLSKTKQSVFILAADDVRANNNEVSALEITIKLALGDNVNIQIESYDRDFSIEDQGVFMVRIPPAKKGSAHYLTWYSQGVLGKTDVGK